MHEEELLAKTRLVSDTTTSRRPQSDRGSRSGQTCVSLIASVLLQLLQPPPETSSGASIVLAFDFASDQ